MGDRGGTATRAPFTASSSDYTRWEIGGEPQRMAASCYTRTIIPDGRSGGNRNKALQYFFR